MASPKHLNNSSANQDTQSILSNKPSSGWLTIRRVAPYLWPKDKPWVKRRVILAVLALFLAKLVAVGTPFFYKTAVDILAAENTSSTWLLSLGVVGLTVAYGMARLFKIGFEELRNVIFARVGQRALRAIALETLTHILHLSMRYHITRKTGGLSRVMERGVKGVSFLLRFMLFSVGPMILELIMISIILIWIFNIWYLAVVSATVILYVWFTTVVTQWRVKIRKEMNDQDKEANEKAIDGLLNFETVKYFSAEHREAERYDHAMAGYESASIKTTKSLAYLNVGQALIVNTGLVLSLLLAARDVSNGTLTVGGFVMVNAYMMQVMMPLNLLGFVYREIRRALVDMDELFELLEQPPEVQDKPNAPPIKIQNGKIEFVNISFSYDNDRPILSNINLTIEPAQTVAIVGTSGAGKSTIGRLLFRFYDINDGAIKIDGQDIRDVTQASLHANIGVVPQDTVLFNDSIYYNIAYGLPNATTQQVEDVAKAAQIHNFIMSLPKGYQTTVGERGLKLSGGEKQRVGIARTLLKNPHILLLDEATSALDTGTEQDIQQSLRQIAKGRTVVTIAHRLSTIVDADKIVVLDDGNIIEQGTHENLLNQNGIYTQMWQRQLKDQSTPEPQ